MLAFRYTNKSPISIRKYNVQCSSKYINWYTTQTEEVENPKRKNTVNTKALTCFCFYIFFYVLAEPIENRFHSDFKELFQAFNAIFSMLSHAFRSKWQIKKWTDKEFKASFGNRRGRKENYSLKWTTRKMKEYENLKMNENICMKKTTDCMKRKNWHKNWQKWRKRRKIKAQKMVEWWIKCMKLCISHKVTTNFNFLPIWTNYWIYVQNTIYHSTCIALMSNRQRN